MLPGAVSSGVSIVGVAVSVDVGVSVGVDVSVGGTGVSVNVGVLVAVGGTGVSVNVGVLVAVFVGVNVTVGLDVAVAVPVRVRVDICSVLEAVGFKVRVGGTVSEMVAVRVGDVEGVWVIWSSRVPAVPTSTNPTQ